VNLEIRRLPFTVARPEGGELARYAFTGSHGTPYLRDLKVFDLDRLVTVMGPADPSVMAMGGGVRENFMDSFDLRTMGMRAGDEVRLAITMDVALGEDARREFAGHHYTTYFGENGDRLVFHATDVRRIDDGTFVSPDEIEGNLDTSPTTVRIAEAANDHGCFSVDSPDAHLPDGIHCTAGCWYLNDGLPYTEQRDAVREVGVRRDDREATMVVRRFGDADRRGRGVEVTLDLVRADEGTVVDAADVRRVEDEAVAVLAEVGGVVVAGELATCVLAEGDIHGDSQANLVARAHAHGPEIEAVHEVLANPATHRHDRRISRPHDRDQAVEVEHLEVAEVGRPVRAGEGIARELPAFRPGDGEGQAPDLKVHVGVKNDDAEDRFLRAE
jgi:hypothetical protein